MKGISKDLMKVKNIMGEHWEIKTIDLEPCLYREFENGINVEVSGLNNNKKKKEVNVYIWSKPNMFGHTVLVYNRIRTFELLRNILNVVVAEWSCKTEEEISDRVDMIYKSRYCASIEHHYVSPVCCSPRKYSFPTFFSNERKGTDFEFNFKRGYCYE